MIFGLEEADFIIYVFEKRLKIGTQLLTKSTFGSKWVHVIVHVFEIVQKYPKSSGILPLFFTSKNHYFTLDGALKPCFLVRKMVFFRWKLVDLLIFLEVKTGVNLWVTINLLFLTSYFEKPKNFNFFKFLYNGTPKIPKKWHVFDTLFRCHLICMFLGKI